MNKMSRVSFCLRIVAFVMFFGYCGFATADVYETSSPHGKIRFQASSTLHDFEGEAQEWFGKVDFNPQTGEVVTPFEIYVSIASLSTNHKKRDSNMSKMFEIDFFPTAVWKVESFQCDSFVEGESVRCHARGIFNIHGESAVHETDLKLTPKEDGFEIETAIDLTTEEFGLKPPSVLGLIRVAKEVKVFVQTEWKKSV